jgi:putative ATPase
MIAVAAARPSSTSGSPAQLSLAEAAIYLARARSPTAWSRRRARRRTPRRPIPSAPPEGARAPQAEEAQVRQKYKYPHDYPGHRVEQEYLPARFSGNRYYEPSGQGEETEEPPVDDTSGETPPV